MFFPECQIKY